MRSRAVALKPCAWTVSALVSSPRARILTGMPLRVARPALAQRVGRDLRARVEARLEVGQVDRLGVRAEGLEGHRLLHVRAAQLAHPHVDRVLAALEARAPSWRRSASRSPSGRGRRSCRCPSPRRGRRACAAGGCRAPGRASAGRSTARGSAVGRPFAGGLTTRSCTSTRWRTAWTMPRSCGRVLVLDGVADPAQAERAQRVELTPVGAVARAPLGDRELAHAASAGAVAAAAAGLGGRALGRRRPSAAVSSRPSTWSTVRPAQLGDLLGRAQRLQPGDRRLDEVDRVLRAEALGEDVVDPGQLEHRAHAAAGDDAGTGRGGLEQHAAGAEDAGRLVGDRRAVLGHPEEVLLRALDALLDRHRDLVGLAVADADDALLVAHHDQRGEREAPAALDDLGDAVDLDDALLEVEAGGADWIDRWPLAWRVAAGGAQKARPASRAPSASALTRPW